MSGTPAADAMRELVRETQGTLGYDSSLDGSASVRLLRAQPLLTDVVAAAELAWWTSYANRRSEAFIHARRRLAESLAALRKELEG